MAPSPKRLGRSAGVLPSAPVGQELCGKAAKIPLHLHVGDDSCRNHQSKAESETEDAGGLPARFQRQLYRRETVAPDQILSHSPELKGQSNR